MIRRIFFILFLASSLGALSWLDHSSQRPVLASGLESWKGGRAGAWSAGRALVSDSPVSEELILEPIDPEMENAKALREKQVFLHPGGAERAGVELISSSDASGN